MTALSDVAVVGTGEWSGAEHATGPRPPTRRSSSTRSSGGRPTRPTQRAAEFGTTPYVDLDEMLETVRPDLVSLCLPNEGHFDTTLRVIRAGYPLLVEKPLVFDLDEADQLLSEADERHLFFAINFNHRYARPVRMAHEAISSGALGNITFATWRFGGEVGTSTHTFANLIETQCHGFDMLEHLCGPIQSVSAHMNDRAGNGYTTMAVALTFASGASARWSDRTTRRTPIPRPTTSRSTGQPGGCRSSTRSSGSHGRFQATKYARSGRPATSTIATATSTTCSSCTSTSC